MPLSKRGYALHSEISAEVDMTEEDSGHSDVKYTVAHKNWNNIFSSLDEKLKVVKH